MDRIVQHPEPPPHVQLRACIALLAIAVLTLVAVAEVPGTVEEPTRSAEVSEGRDLSGSVSAIAAVRPPSSERPPSTFLHRRIVTAITPRISSGDRTSLFRGFRITDSQRQCFSEQVRPCALDWQRNINLATLRYAAIQWNPSSAGLQQHCAFKSSRANDPRIVEFFSNYIVRFQGDSTLREMASVMLKFLSIDGELAKKNANKSTRATRHFYRRLAPNSLPVAGDAATVAAAAAYSYRMLFRFDFYTSQLREEVPEAEIGGGDGCTFFSRLEDSPASRQLWDARRGAGGSGHFLIVSFGVHTVSEMIMKKGVQDPHNYVPDILASFEQFLKDNLTTEAANGGHGGPNSVDWVIVALQSVECDSMRLSTKEGSGFRKMSKFCRSIEKHLELLNNAIIERWGSVDGVRSSTAPNSSSVEWDSPGDRAAAFERVVVFGPFKCGPRVVDGFCTRDGLHFRTKYVRLRADALLNTLVRIERCMQM